MKVDPKSLFSDLALNGPPLFFPDADPDHLQLRPGPPGRGDVPARGAANARRRGPRTRRRPALEYITFGFDASTADPLPPDLHRAGAGQHRAPRAGAAWSDERNAPPDLTADSFILASGSVQAIAMAMTAFLSPGDGVLVEAATFPYAMRFMEMRGADVRPVAIDQDGIDVDDLERQILALKADGIRPKLLYVIPTFQLPTCVVTTLDRRRRIIELAHQHEMIVLEDSVYADLRYDGESLPSLLSMDDTGLVIQSHGFSKIVAPALRLGWMTGGPEMIAGIAAVRQDLGVSQWMCRLMAEFMRSGSARPAHRTRQRCLPAQAGRRRRGRARALRPVRRLRAPERRLLPLASDERRGRLGVARAPPRRRVICRPGEVFMGRDTGSATSASRTATSPTTRSTAGSRRWARRSTAPPDRECHPLRLMRRARSRRVPPAVDQLELHDLAGRVRRQDVDELDVARHLVVRQPLPAPFDELLLANERARTPHDPGHAHLAEARSGTPTTADCATPWWPTSTASISAG